MSTLLEQAGSAILSVQEETRNLQDIEVVCLDGGPGFDLDACVAFIQDIANQTVTDLVAADENLASPDATSSDDIWMLLAGALVFFMHAGFSLLEAGSVRKQSVVSILFKNVITVAIGAVAYWFFGFGFGYGQRGGENPEDDIIANSFIGNNFFFYDFNEGGQTPAFFFFQFTFAATAATIVSGAVAERINLIAYFIAATWITAFVFPVVTHWVWSDFGFMSAFAEDGDLIGGSIGLIDFAGSGVVHATGGFMALMGARILGPRKGRFGTDGEAIVPMVESSPTLMTLGTLILWFGWYGFNPGSSLEFNAEVISKAAVTTTLAPAAAGVTATIYSRLVLGYFDIGLLLNGILAGLVSITAGCVAVTDASSLAIGVIGVFVYIGAAKALEMLKIDDPIGAVPVHGACGVWGVISVGIFLNNDAVQQSYGVVPDNQGAQFGMQIVGIIIIVLWALLWGGFLFLLMSVLNILRVDEEVEDMGVDKAEFGGEQVVNF